ncbi:hypothetical protein KC19_11G082400, partial [Ceratodon purpureus]
MGNKRNVHRRNAISVRRELRLEGDQRREQEALEAEEQERQRELRVAQKREHRRTWRTRARPSGGIPLGSSASDEGNSQPNSGEEPAVDLNDAENN